MRMTDERIHVLEVVEALGAVSTYGRLRAAAHRQALRSLRATVTALRNQGMLRQYAIGHYTITSEGRAALRSHFMQRAG